MTLSAIVSFIVLLCVSSQCHARQQVMTAPFGGKQSWQSVTMTSTGLPMTKSQEVKDLPANSSTTGTSTSSSFVVQDAGPSLHHQRKKNRSHGSSRRAVKKSQPSSVCFPEDDDQEDIVKSAKVVGEEKTDLHSSASTVSVVNGKDKDLDQQPVSSDRAVLPRGRSHVQSRSIQKPRVGNARQRQQQQQQQLHVQPKLERKGNTSHVQSRMARHCSLDEQQKQQQQQQQLLKQRKTASKAWKASRFGSSMSTLSTFSCHRIQGHPWTWVLES